MNSGFERFGARHRVRRWQRLSAASVIAGLLLSFQSGVVVAQLEFERAPINYGRPPFQDRVSELQNELEAGDVQLTYDQKHGYLSSLLKLLEIEASSQVLVHSKTSLQIRHISPRHPRAIYFNDDVYVGWVQGGDVIEIMAADPAQGAVFYTLPQSRTDAPRFTRDTGRCLLCHVSSRTQDVPGGMVRSVFVDRSGQPSFGSGTFDIDHRSPFEERWGGYYVTGTHGSMRHLGNVVSEKRSDPRAVDREAGANLTSLTERFDVARYLTPHSDIVALMVLEHQTQMHNYLTLANYECRSATHYDAVMNAALDRPEDHVSDTTQRRIASAGDKLLRYMLFADEFPLEAPVQGTSAFSERFQRRGPRDSRGRSLRDFDLKTRMFKYPCSYLIYSPSFDQLPKPVKQYVVTRLDAILQGRDDSDEFSYLSRRDRHAIREILAETKPELWK